MKQQPDKLFFEKLNNFTKEVPPLTWERIEERLDRKKKKFFWLSAAAAVSAVAITTFLILQADSSEISALAENKPAAKTPHAAEQILADRPEDQKEKTVVLREDPTVPAIAQMREKKKKSISKKQFLKSEIRQNEMALRENVHRPENSPVAEDSLILPYSGPTQLAFQAPEKKDNVTIVLTADQTKNYLITKNSISQATSEEKKSSTLKKLLKKAADLKVNQDPFGELRQRKNEILALNFRSDKQRGQKK